MKRNHVYMWLFANLTKKKILKIIQITFPLFLSQFNWIYYISNIKMRNLKKKKKKKTKIFNVN